MRPSRVLFLAAALAVAGVLVGAQARGPVPEAGYVGLGVMLRQLGNVGIFLQTTAHPDDESNPLLTMLDRGQGYRATLLTATRGTGGQNEIGPELFEALSVLRTSELESVHRFDGAEQYFARAIDFGYSFSVEESYEKWGREEILADYVRIIRTLRPDVIVTMRPDGQGGGEHHQAQARITGDAFRMAGDAAMFPEQIAEGLRPWQPKKLYYTASYGFRGEPAPPPDVKVLTVATDLYDPFLGATYAEVGAEARSYHKCQGMGQLLALPGPQVARYRLGDTVLPGGTGRDDGSLFDGIDASVQGLAQYVAGPVPGSLSEGLAAIAREADGARQAFAARGMDAATKPLAAGIAAIRALRARLPGLGLDPAAVYEIDYRLAGEEAEFEEAAVAAQALRIDLLANDGLVVPGQAITVQASVANRGATPMQVNGVSLVGFDGDAACKPEALKPGGIFRCELAAGIPASARLTTPYWQPIPGTARYEFDKDAPFGLPFEPTPFRARVELSIAGADVTAERPVKFRYEGNIFSGEKRMELLVVPRYSVTVAPEIAIVPQGATRPGEADGSRELRVVVTNGERGPGKATVRLDVPAGWKTEPASAAVAFAREDEEATVRFLVTPPAGVAAGEYRVRAVAQDGGATFGQGYQVIEYPHVNRRHRVIAAETTIKAIDVKTQAGLRVGYVMGVGDQVPPAIRQLGVQLDLLGADDLGWGDLSRYDTIVTGVRAYERRADLRANNDRLLRYVEGGGTLIVQYNKYEFNEAQYGPYPVKVSSNRVTGEEAPVRVLVPGHPVFTTPNRIDEDTWKGWVQERGLYFLGPDKDPRYLDLVSLEDPFPHNPGVKTGALVEARVGKGRWIYVGLGLWRQLPAGTDGAYALLANLIGLK
ncbi:MAG TPA: PIG-L family deacetylase [Vicinamibacterales bacterium]|nr:PIG-L family deacetylase [Vicinamibacterales bacterium]